jgi:hypothetical protein
VVDLQVRQGEVHLASIAVNGEAARPVEDGGVLVAPASMQVA